MDLCVLDAESMRFTPGILAASALYHFSSCKLATHVSGYDYQDLAKVKYKTKESCLFALKMSDD